MDHQRERFRQHTPYLQWIKDKEQGPGSTGGEDILELVFLSCAQAAEEIIDRRQIAEDAVYLFAREGGVVSGQARAAFSEVFARNERAVLAYADEDHLGTLEELYGIDPDAYPRELLRGYQFRDTGAYRGRPWLKPGFSPDTLRSFFYIGSIFAMKGSALAGAYHPKESLYELVVRAAEAAWEQARAEGDAHAGQRIVHIPRVLFTNDSLERSGKLEGFRALADSGRPGAPGLRVSVIIPSKDNSAMLSCCIESLRAHTAHQPYELIVVDNGSSAEERERIASYLDGIGGRYLYDPGPFNFSVMCNTGAQAADGGLLLFLNDDIEAFEDGWMEAMCDLAVRPHVGAVGAKLLYPVSEGGWTIQHAGITNMAVGPVHKLCGWPDGEDHYHGRNRAVYDMLALTGACLMVGKEKFMQAGGFAPELAVAYNDVALCMRLYEMGYYNILQNDAVLIHHESHSRGQDLSDANRRRLALEKELLYKKHPLFDGWDPFYHQDLVQTKKADAYDIEYAFECDHPVAPERMSPKEIGKLPRLHEDKILKKLLGENVPMLSIDSIGPDDMGRYTLLRGWAILMDRDNAGLERTLILQDMQDNSRAYALRAACHLREDVQAMFGNNTALSGLHVVFDQTVLGAGTYRIGMLLRDKRRYLVWSEAVCRIEESGGVPCSALLCGKE